MTFTNMFQIFLHKNKEIGSQIQFAQFHCSYIYQRTASGEETHLLRYFQI